MNYITNLLRRVFPPVTLESVLSVFNRALVDLEEVIARNNERLADVRNQVRDLNAETDALRAEIDQATTVSRNIAALIKG